MQAIIVWDAATRERMARLAEEFAAYVASQDPRR